MKFKIDQNLPIEAADLLTVAGHDAMTVYQQSLGGASDERIVDVCKDEDRILITADLDLSDIRRYPPAQTPGYAVRPINGRLWIVEPDRLRIRGGE